MGGECSQIVQTPPSHRIQNRFNPFLQIMKIHDHADGIERAGNRKPYLPIVLVKFLQRSIIEPKLMRSDKMSGGVDSESVAVDRILEGFHRVLEGMPRLAGFR